MYCKQCGTQIADDALFCSKCGTKQDLIPSPIEQKIPETADSSIPTEPTSVEVTQSSPEENPPTPNAASTDIPHSWRCVSCGNMIEREPCIVCARGPQIAVAPKTNNNRIFHCPTCGQQQNHKDYCHNCGQLFVDISAPTTRPALSMRYYNFLVDFLFYAAAALNFICAILYISGGLTFDSGKSIDILFALYSIGFGGFSIAIRNKMAKFQKDGLAWFRIARYIGIGFSFITMFANLAKLDNTPSYLMTEEMVSLYTFVYLCSFAVSIGIAVAELSYFKKREDMFTH